MTRSALAIDPRDPPQDYHTTLLLDRLGRLSFIEGPVELEPIGGGITNHNFVVRAGGRASYVARLCEDRPLLGIDRRNEVVCERWAAGLGLAPEVVHPDHFLARLLGQQEAVAAVGEEVVGGDAVLRRRIDRPAVERHRRDALADRAGQVGRVVSGWIRWVE